MTCSTADRCSTTVFDMAATRKLDGDAIRRRRAAGETVREVAEAYGCSTATVSYHASRGTVLEGGDVVAGHGRSEISAVASAYTDQHKT